MKVIINWSEQVSYSTTIEVDEAAVREALKLPADVALTEGQVQWFLDYNDDDGDWFEQCDTGADFVGVDERQIDNLSFVQCAHAKQHVNDRSQFVCDDCGEELGR